MLRLAPSPNSTAATVCGPSKCKRTVPTDATSSCSDVSSFTALEASAEIPSAGRPRQGRVSGGPHHRFFERWGSQSGYASDMAVRLSSPPRSRRTSSADRSSPVARINLTCGGWSSFWSSYPVYRLYLYLPLTGFSSGTLFPWVISTPGPGVFSATSIRPTS